MSTTNSIQDELNELNSSLPATKLNTYSVPDVYFDSLAAVILSKVKEQAISAEEELASVSPFLASLSRKMPYSIPEGYLNNNIEGLTAITSDDVVPDIIKAAGKAMLYNVPADYFQNFAGTVLVKVEKPQARVIAFNSTRWMRYAAAAIITGIIAISGILYFKTNSSVDPAQHPHEWLAGKLKSVSNKELDEFIETTGVNSQQVASHTGSKEEVNKMIKDLPTGELDAFLSQVPESDDASLFN